MTRPRVLIVSPTCPVPPMGGAALRVEGWLRAARDGADVALATLVRDSREAAGLKGLVDDGLRVVASKASRRATRRLRDLAIAGLTGRPYLVVANTDRHLELGIEGLCRSWRPDVVQLEQLSALGYRRLPAVQAAAMVYSAHNVESRIARGPDPGALGWRFRRRAARVRRTEVDAARAAERVVAVTSAEAAWFRRHDAAVDVIPNALWLDRYPQTEVGSGRQSATRPTLLFVGHLAYPPNRDAVERLIRDVLPRVRAVIPDCRCLIAGRSPSRSLRRLGRHGVEIVADAVDLDPVWRQATVFVCPLRWAGGSRLKLIEAAARGVPIVTSSVGREGLAYEPPTDLLVADDAATTAQQVVATLSATAATAARVARARHRTIEHHDWSRWAFRVRQLYEDLYEDLARHHRP